MIWIASGLVMSLLASDRVRSEHLRNGAPLPALLPPVDLIPAPAMITRFTVRGVQVAAISLHTIAGRMVYDVTATDGARLLVDPRTGESLSPIDRKTAEQISAFDRGGSHAAASVELLHEADGDYRGATPVWRVRYDDAERAAVYVSPVTGEVIQRTNRLWRLHDFVWMLHIMDYGNRSNYNNPMLRGAAGLGVALALSGVFVLVGTMLRRRRHVQLPDGPAR